MLLSPTFVHAKDENRGNGNAYGQDNGNNGNAYGQDNGNNGQGNDSGTTPASTPNSPSSPNPASSSIAPSASTQGTPSQASPSAPGSNETTSDQDEALKAVEDARALPLETISQRVHETNAGEIVDARLLTVDGFLLYEVKVLDGEQLDVLYYYARTGNRVGD